MDFDLDKRTAALSVGEFSDFSLGPRDASGGGAAGIWRAQLGTHWHNELRAQATAEHGPAAEFEIAITGQIVHRGWTLTLTGRIDQLIRADARVTLREIKTVTRPLPADETELRADYPEYFIQIATYAALRRLGSCRAGSSVRDVEQRIRTAGCAYEPFHQDASTAGHPPLRDSGSSAGLVSRSAEALLTLHRKRGTTRRVSRPTHLSSSASPPVPRL